MTQNLKNRLSKKGAFLVSRHDEPVLFGICFFDRDGAQVLNRIVFLFLVRGTNFESESESFPVDGPRNSTARWLLASLESLQSHLQNSRMAPIGELSAFRKAEA